MADILIRGVAKMPGNCRECMFAGFGGMRNELNVCMFSGESQSSLSYERMSKCPLVPLPEGHGRLIDADAIEYTYTTARGNDDGHNWRIFAVGQDEIDDMPTIVPAEGGGEE